LYNTHNDRRIHGKGKVKWPLYRTGVAQGLGRGTALLFHDRGTRRGWVVSSKPRPHFTPGKDPVPILHEVGWAPGPVWTGGKPRPHRDSIPERLADSQMLYWLSYPAHGFTLGNKINHFKVGLYLFVESNIQNVFQLYTQYWSSRSYNWWKWDFACWFGFWFLRDVIPTVCTLFSVTAWNTFLYYHKYYRFSTIKCNLFLQRCIHWCYILFDQLRSHRK